MFTRMAIKKKERKRRITNVGKNVEKFKFSCDVNGDININVLWNSCYGKQFGGSSIN